MTAKSVHELLHVPDHIVPAIARERVALGQYSCPGRFRPQFSAPDIRVRQKESLQLRQAVFSRGIEGLALRVQSVLQAGHRNVNPAIVRSIFAG